MDRILIVRLSAIGDVVLSVPVLCALRKSFPNARIGWVVENAGAQLLKGHPALDDLIALPKATFRSPKAFLKLVRSLRDWKPDVTIDLQGLTKSSLLAYLSGAKTRVGLTPSDFDGREWSSWLNNRLCTPSQQHIILRGLEALQTIGVQSTEVRYDLPESDEETAFAARVMSERCLDQPFAIINVGAGWPSKIWPNDRYAAVAQHLSKHWGLMSLILWSGEKEQAAAQEIAKLCVGFAEVAPNTSLTQLRGLIRASKIFVGSDTGPMHLSVATGTPTIGMIGPMPIERVGPLGDSNRAIQRDRLPANRKSDRKIECGPMLSIQVSDVCQSIDQIMHSKVGGKDSV